MDRRKSHLELEPEAPARYLYASDGSLFESDASENAATAAVSYLIRLRQNGAGITPKAAAMLIESRGRGEAFPNREAWLEFPELWQWPGVPCTTSAEDAVKRAFGTDRDAAMRLFFCVANPRGHAEWPDNCRRAEPAKAREWMKGFAARFPVTASQAVQRALALTAPTNRWGHAEGCACEECWTKGQSALQEAATAYQERAAPIPRP